jgi:hypothetical protein
MQRTFVPQALQGLALVLGICSLTSVASADELLIAKSWSSSEPAVYRRSAGGSCSRETLTTTGGPTYRVYATNQDDIIVVFNVGDRLDWCGYKNIRPLQLPTGTHLTIDARDGNDVVWGGELGGPGARYISLGRGDDHASTGPYGRVVGSAGDDVFLIPGDSSVEGNSGHGLFCTAVSGHFTNTDANRLTADLSGYNARYGPAGDYEFGMDDTGASSSNCDLAQYYIVSKVMAMLSQ